MEVLTIIAFVFSGAALCLNLFKGKQKAIAAPAHRKEITGSAPPKGHSMKRLYIKTVKYETSKCGWTWECECGVSETMPNYPFNRNGEPESPTEGYVLNRWKKHAQLYGKFTDLEEENEWKFKFEVAIQEFSDYKKKCFCKDLH